MTLWFEDIDTQTVWPLGEYTFTEEEIIRFAKRYDPQYFHVDPEAAKHSHFGGLIASGWHTVSVGHKIMVDFMYAHDDMQRENGEEPGVSGPSPGVSKMEFKAPVRSGDTIRFDLSVKNKRKSNSLPGWGLLTSIISAYNEKEELVYRSEIASFSKLRDYKPKFKERVLMAMAAMPLLKNLLRK